MFVVHLAECKGRLHLPTGGCGSWRCVTFGCIYWVKKVTPKQKKLDTEPNDKVHINNVDVVDEDKSNLLTEKNKMVQQQQQSFVSIFVCPV